ncbi:MAG: hypothetical protein HQK79_19555 [Desulfobacterales bacterium]|nr:hypothetical protein [Desulfobacterales bacterium]MBF0396546.1 hypothetical protein [Desulfobacterales bacterium]
MKIITLFLIIIFCFQALNYADELRPKVKTLIGRVESVSFADPIKETKSEIVVTLENNKKISFIIKNTTTIYDINGKAATSEKLLKVQTVKVKYIITNDGVSEARSIKIIK